MKKEVKEKKCNKCGDVKPIDDFPKGRGAVCKVCKRPMWNAKSKKSYARPEKKVKSKLYYEENKEHYKNKRKERDNANRPELRKRQKIYEDKNRDKLNAQRRERYHSNPNIRIRIKMDTIIKRSLRKKIKKTDSTLGLLGCNIIDFKKHIALYFKDGMSWENYSYETWHIDHRVAINAFELTNPLMQRICFSYKNMTPMWGKENMQKNKFIQVSDIDFLIEDLENIKFFKSKDEAVLARQQIIDNSVKKGILKYDNETEYRVRRESAEGAEVSPRKDRVFAGEQGRQEDVRVSA